MRIVNGGSRVCLGELVAALEGIMYCGLAASLECQLRGCQDTVAPLCAALAPGAVHMSRLLTDQC